MHIFAQGGVDLLKFIPGTYLSGRISLATMVIIAVLLENIGRFLGSLSWEVKNE